MRRWIALFLSIYMIFSMVSCGRKEKEEVADRLESSDGSESSQNMMVTQMEQTESNILIAYFTWADNTRVENPDVIDVDATTSASVLQPGNAAKIAEWIGQRTNGDLFSIIVKEPYSSDYDECLDRAADEKAENARPELVSHVENMEQYDTIFLGFPNWWYTVPMAIHSFLDEYDFSGKTVIPFVTHGTGGLASTVNDIKADLPDSVIVKEAVGVYRPEVDESRPKVGEWLDGLGYIEQKENTN